MILTKLESEKKSARYNLVVKISLNTNPPKTIKTIKIIKPKSSTLLFIKKNKPTVETIPIKDRI
jgi:hypothetical protein